MRVIAGTARGRRLQSVPGSGTRPITDRAKEALFSILQPELPGARVLDLFAGTGQVGIEALSRGAAACDFNELAPEALKVIQANLAVTGLAGPEARLMRRDAFRLLDSPPQRPYDLVFVAPPQYKGLWKRAVMALDAACAAWLGPEGLLVVQIDPREGEDLPLDALVLTDRRHYGSVELRFYRPALDDDLDAPRAVARLFDAVREGNRLLDQGVVPAEADRAAWFRAMDVLDVLPATPAGGARVTAAPDAAATADLREAAPADPAAAESWATGWARARLTAKGKKNFKEADRIRDLLKAAGWEVRDNRDGTVEVRKL